MERDDNRTADADLKQSPLTTKTPLTPRREPVKPEADFKIMIDPVGNQMAFSTIQLTAFGFTSAGDARRNGYQIR